MIKIVLLGMLKIVLLGTGNVARHLFTELNKYHDIEILEVVGRNTLALEFFNKQVHTSTNFQFPASADLYIIAVSDDAVEDVANSLEIHNKLIVHTSGSVAMTSLERGNRSGVFYPLQSFSKNRPLEFKDMPICIEAEEEADLISLNNLAELLSNQVFKISSEQRKSLHLSAVFVNNFTNHLYAIGQDICQSHGLPFSILQPLILETAKKILEISPNEAQTGPARRNDLGTIEKHKELLQKESYKQIYALMSTSIQQAHEKKL